MPLWEENIYRVEKEWIMSKWTNNTIQCFALATYDMRVFNMALVLCILLHSVHWGINPHQNHHPLILAKPSFKPENCPPPPF